MLNSNSNTGNKLAELKSINIVSDLKNDTAVQAYEAPKLTQFGKVSDITRGTGSQFFDEGGIDPLF